MDEPRLRSPHYRAMTRYTNTGRKRTHLQASSFDPNYYEILTTAASMSAVDASGTLQAQQEVRADALP